MGRRPRIELVRALGQDRAAVVGHDRGALVAFRAALDHPDAVSHLGVLDVVPTGDMWDHLAGADGVFAFHLCLPAHPAPLPERLVEAAPDTFLGTSSTPGRGSRARSRRRSASAT